MIVNGVAMKENTIIYKGIRTNNLKNIDLNVPKGCFWGIAGPSGSGKSSLAYATIYAISQYEWEKVSNTPAGAFVSFQIDDYKNIIPAIALKQENLNNNPRSTIATFLRIDKDFRLLFASVNKVSPSLFSFNNPKNACPYCDGLGFESVTDDTKLINWESSILGHPFKPWQKGYQQKLLEKYAESRSIPLNVSLNQLPDNQVSLLLHDISNEKFAITYKANGKTKTHNFKYIGLLEEINSLRNDKLHISSSQKLVDFSHTRCCAHCNGKRFSDEALQYKYNDKSLGDLYMMELDDLDRFVTSSMKHENNEDLKKLMNNINRILEGLINAKLEYLNLNRSIPSLSGGELQRIRLVNILTSQINDMMYIIDEPSARLHVSEYDSIISDFVKLRDAGNTILMIEHNPYFLNKTDKNIFIGPSSGDKGGHLMTNEPEAVPYSYLPRECDRYINFKSISDNNLKDVDVDIPVSRITGIYGPSGSGKSTLAKNIGKGSKNTEYINQKPLKGSKSSTIASYSGILDGIKDLFAKANDMKSDLFSFTHEEGQCPACKGRGEITYELDFGKTRVDVICDECGGMRYNHDALLYKYKEMSIYQILNLTIDHLVEFNIFQDSTICKQLINLQKLGLGYLTLFRTTDTLSGGEAQRLKLIKFIGKKLKDKLFIFDEPLRGLSYKSANDILSIFNNITLLGGTVVFIEHNILGLSSCDYVIEMGPGKGKNGGKVIFQGSIAEFKRTERWMIYKIN